MSDEPRIPSTPTSGEDVMRRRLSPQERILLLDLWQRPGLTARDFSALVGLSRRSSSGSVAAIGSVRPA